MRIRVLGSSAGGGLPQWNCNCHNCQFARTDKSSTVKPRTQSSIAVTDSSNSWVIFNTSPDIRQQLNAFPEIREKDSMRNLKIVAVLVVDAQIDHTIGLMILREGNPLDLYCTKEVYADLTTAFPIVSILDHYCGVHYHPIEPGKPFQVDALPNLVFTPIASLSKPPPYSAYRHKPRIGDNIAVFIEDKSNDSRLLYAPAIETIDDGLYSYMERCDYLLLDGTFWTEDEMKAIQTPYKKSCEMGHLAYSGKNGMIEQLQKIQCPKTLIHINNSNPVLDESSAEHQTLINAGFTISYDNMEINL